MRPGLSTHMLSGLVAGAALGVAAHIRTTVNVTGDLAAAVVVARGEPRA